MPAADPAVEVADLAKRFRYRNPDPNSNQGDMWFEYLLGFITRGRWRRPFSPALGEVVALDGVSFEVRRGEFFGLLGPNGAGKTTLMKIASGLLLPDAGRAVLDGYDVVRETAEARASMTTVPSANWLVFDYAVSLQVNLELWGALYGLDRKTCARRARRALEIVGLEERAGDHPGNLSGGMRQRLAIAKGLLVATPIFLLDEPTVNIDPNSAQQIRSFIRLELNRKLGQTVLLATHDMAEAEALCDRVAIIDKGRLAACGTVPDLISAVPGKLLRFTVRGETERAVAALRSQAAVREVEAVFGPAGIDLLTVHLVGGEEKACAAHIQQAGCMVMETAPASFGLSHVFRHVTR